MANETQLLVVVLSGIAALAAGAMELYSEHRSGKITAFIVLLSAVVVGCVATFQAHWQELSEQKIEEAVRNSDRKTIKDLDENNKELRRHVKDLEEEVRRMRSSQSKSNGMVLAVVDGMEQQFEYWSNADRTAVLRSIGELRGACVDKLQALAEKQDLAPLAKSAELGGLATSGQLLPLAKSSELAVLATSVQLTPLAKSSDLLALATSAQVAPLAKLSDLSGLATSAQVSPLAKSSELNGLATAAQLGPLAKSAELNGLGICPKP